MKLHHVSIEPVLKGDVLIGGDQLEPVDDSMRNQLVRHLAFRDGAVISGAILIEHENPRNETAGASLIKHRGRWFLGVAHDSEHEHAVVRLQLDLNHLFGDEYSDQVYVLRDRATRYYMNQPHRRSENDYTVVRGALELRKLHVILRPGQFHFFEMIPIHRSNRYGFDKVMKRKRESGQASKPFDYACLGALHEISPCRRGKHYRFFRDGKVEREITAFWAGREHPVESDGLFSYFVSREIGHYLDDLAERGEYAGEIQIYNIQGGKISFKVENEVHRCCESIELHQPGSILLKNLMAGTEIDFQDLEGADFMIHQYQDPAWFIDRGHAKFSEMQLESENELIFRSSEKLMQLGILVVALSNENDLDYDPFEGGKVTPWVHTPGQPIRIGHGGNDAYPSAAASIVVADSNTSNTVSETDLMIYGDPNVGVFPSEMLHHHLTENWNHGGHEGEIRPLELYHVACGGMGLFVQILGENKTAKEYLLHLRGGDTVVIDPFVIHGIAYIDTPYSHAVVQIPGVWDLARLGGRCKHGFGEMREVLNRRPQLRSHVLKAMSDRDGGVWQIGDEIAKPLF